MTELQRPRQSQCLALFGNPTHPDFLKHIVHVEVPFRMAMGDLPIHAIKINQVARPALEALLDEFWVECGHDQARVDAQHVSSFSGDWVVRQMRGLHALSMHAYGLAFDLDAPHNPLAGRHPFFRPDHPFVALAEKHGFVWGGRWNGRPDAMHFQFAEVG